MKRTALWTLVAAVATVVAAACSGAVAGSVACKGGDCDSPDSGAPPEAGTPTFDEAVVPGPRDGSRLTREGIDRRHGTRCLAHPAADGQVRCWPDTPYSLVIDGIFTDPACAQPLAMVPGPGTCDLAALAFVTNVQSNGSCPNPTGEARAFRVLRESSGAGIYRLSAKGACEPFSMPSSDVGNYWAAVTPTEPDDWVELARDVTPVTTDLAVSYWEGTDGSRFFDSLRLWPTEEPCEPYPPPKAGRTSHCIPRSALPPSFPHASYDCIPPEETTITCTSGMALLAAYPELQVTLTGTGRLRTAYLTAEGQKLRPIGHHDMELNGPCHREVLEDGVAYCIGAGKFSSLQGGLFTDPACSQEVASYHHCTGQLASAVQIGPGSECGDVPQFLEHTEHEGPIYGFTFADPVGCAEYPREEDVAYYRPGPPLAPSELFAPYPDQP